MKKLSLLLVLLILLSAALAPLSVLAADAPPFEVQLRAAYLYNMDTETVIYENRSDEPMYPASLTKIMTCILVLENISNLDTEMVTYPPYVQDYLYKYQMDNGAISLGGLIAGEEMSMRKMLYALMLPSANEAAMIVADHIGGSQEGFVQMMNARAKALGCTNTNFVNPNGLFDEFHVTTAHDMAIMALHAMTLDGFMDIANTQSYESGATNKHDNLTWTSTNQMMDPTNLYYYPPLHGLKTGTLPQSGRCFVSTATRDGFTYLLVAMGGPYLDADGAVLAGNSAFDDTRKIYDWVFDTYKVKSLMEKNKRIAEIPLHLCMEQDHLLLVTGERFTALVNKSIEAGSVTVIPEIPDYIDAPVTKGDLIGEARLMLSGVEVGRVPLLAAETVAASPMLVMFEQVKSVMRSFWFKFIVILLVLIIVGYVALMVIRNRNRRKRGGYRPKRRI